MDSLVDGTEGLKLPFYFYRVGARIPPAVAIFLAVRWRASRVMELRCFRVPVTIGRGGLSFSGTGTDALSIGGLVGDTDSVLGVVEGIEFIFLSDFDEKVEVLMGLVVDGEVVF